MSSVSSRLDTVAEVADMAEEMADLLKKANVKNKRLLECLNKLRHEAAKHEHDLAHILAKKGDKEDVELVKEVEIGEEELREMLLNDGMSPEQIDSLLGKEE